jgi:hypothetical protein
MSSTRKRILILSVIIGAGTGSYLGWNRAPRAAQAASVTASADSAPAR